MTTKYGPGSAVLGNWKLTRLLGEGSYGRVFEAEREDFGSVYKAAIKIITIPQSQGEIISARAEGMSDESVMAYFRGFVEEIVREFALMARLKGTANVVSYEDHTVIQHEDGTGWDVIIRMELLTPLLHYTIERPFTRQAAIKLGIDICRALELCQKFNIIHRDIKPENIFVSDLGDYKLGDFGIARTVEKTTSGLSKKGTYTYMAPEVYREGAYGSSVDIYSLGIVLYRLLNDNRAPFLPEYPTPITHGDREAALAKRIGGAPLPGPKNADGRLAEIVLKACAYDSKDRYSSPMQMRQELEAILYSREEAPIIYPKGDEAPIKSVEYVSGGETPAAPAMQEYTESLFGADAASEATESVFGRAVEPGMTEMAGNTIYRPRINEKPITWEGSRRPLIAAIFIGIFMAANTVGLIIPMRFGNFYTFNIIIIAESVLFIVFVFKKKPIYIVFPLICNAIGIISTYGLIYLNYSSPWDIFTSTWPAIMSITMIIVYWLTVKGNIKKVAAILIMLVCCAVLSLLDMEYFYGFPAFAIGDYQGMPDGVSYFVNFGSHGDIFFYVLEKLLIVLHYAAYIIII